MRVIVDDFFYLGTNINEALLRAVQMLVRTSNHDLLEQRSVSMIIFVSDGDPTVGKICSKFFFFSSLTNIWKRLLGFKII